MPVDVLKDAIARAKNIKPVKFPEPKKPKEVPYDPGPPTVRIDLDKFKDAAKWNVGDTVTLILSGSVTSVRQDEYEKCAKVQIREIAQVGKTK